MENENPIENTLKDVELFLKQQAEIFGDEFFLPEKIEPQSTPPISASLAGTSDADRISTGGDGLKSKTIRISEERGLFERVVTNAEWKIDPNWSESDSLERLDSAISKCMKCSLGATRRKFVFGVGNPNSKLVLIGEAPGADEDEQGEPFVGRAGQLLNKILAAVQLKREDVYICNILKCRPPNNRDPLPDEAEACEPYLKKQLEIIKPKIILCLGRIAGQTLLKTNATLTELRKNTYEYEGIKVLVTFHPAALLRNPNWKRPAWEDVQKMRKMYDEL